MELDGWAERPNDGKPRQCSRCNRRFGPQEVYFYVTEDDSNLPVCWMHVKGETGPR
jgi:hypothetical protein